MRDAGFANAKPFQRAGAVVLAMVLAAALSRCGTAGGTTSVSPPPPPPPAVSVSVSPGTANVYLGGTQPMTASVTGTADAAVSWAVDGVVGGNTTEGTITAGGLYTAPSNLPSPATVTITATSQADTAAAGDATLTIESGVQVTISPPSATVAAGAMQTFTAQVAGSGNPDTAVTWSVTGSSCPSGCGTLAASGNSASYTAPASLSSSETVAVTATSVADPTKSATATVTDR